LSRIILKGINKSYGDVPAVRNLNLEVEEGQFLTLLGPSGCGKTTTLRVIAGLEEPDSGEVWIGDILLNSRTKGIFVAPENRGLGMIFQSYALWPHMTVGKNITLGLEQMKLSKAQIRERMRAVLDKVQLGDLTDRYPSELSGGQQQRVAVARMLAAEPEIFLMDEPLSNLDAMLRVDMRGELKRLHRELQATTVYVTHDQVEALTLSDRIAVMHLGELRQVGTPEQIYKRPVDLFVARFVGSPRVNTIRGRLTSKDGVPVFSADGIEIAVPMDLDTDAKELIGAVRPEDIEVSRTKVSEWLEMQSYSILPAGSETIINVRKGLLTLSVKVSGFADIHVDEPVWINIQAKNLNFYDPRTERLIG
jgi:multiple sugar transport system ATP-binding protein